MGTDIERPGGIPYSCGIAGSGGIADSHRNSTRLEQTTGGDEMIVLSALREYWFADGREASVAAAKSGKEGKEKGPPPIAGYGDLDRRDLMSELCKHSQTELAAIEAYECSHKNRPAVLDKLRYLRGPEPLPGYDALGDALGGEEVLAAFADADVETLQRIRAYERKFQRRPDVLEELERLRRKHRTQRLTAAPDSYQAASAGHS